MRSRPTPSEKRTTTMPLGSWPQIRIAEVGSSASQVTICNYAATSCERRAKVGTSQHTFTDRVRLHHCSERCLRSSLHAESSFGSNFLQDVVRAPRGARLVASYAAAILATPLICRSLCPKPLTEGKCLREFIKGCRNKMSKNSDNEHPCLVPL
ncbi:hypothetical protein NDU88_006817 [Pleurodeles waltl]|uniref:Uncharacterized protein n=1 Tax=Pleurodeles waltl TaxID=8319 RepID=A0AAV7X3W7_PLEWA|nr:hypothetical protein NDU88_006817 [Pleurodeles waltl]